MWVRWRNCARTEERKRGKKKKKKQYGNGGVCLLFICEVKATRREIARSLRSIYYGVGGWRGKEFSIMRDGEHKKRDQREGSLCMSCPSTQHRIRHPCVFSLSASAFLCVCVCVECSHIFASRSSVTLFFSLSLFAFVFPFGLCEMVASFRLGPTDPMDNTENPKNKRDRPTNKDLDRSQ